MLDNKFLKKFNLSKFIVIFSTKLLFKKKNKFWMYKNSYEFTISVCIHIYYLIIVHT